MPASLEHQERMLRHLRKVQAHDMTAFTSPINVTVRCSCGWRRTIDRRQNALARAAKVRTAIAEHEREIAP